MNWETIYECQIDAVIRAWVEGMQWRLSVTRLVSQA